MTDPQEGDSLGLPFDFDIAVKDSAWADVLADPDPVCARAILAALSVIETPRHGELSIALVDDAAIQTLNRDHRSKDMPTNVLSFPNDGPAPLLGDIVLARETLLREAEEKGVTAVDHAVHLLIHSFLHLQGYSHDADEEAELMEGLEIKALASLGIDNPYQIKEQSHS